MKTKIHKVLSSFKNYNKFITYNVAYLYMNQSVWWIIIAIEIFKNKKWENKGERNRKEEKTISIQNNADKNHLRCLRGYSLLVCRIG